MSDVTNELGLPSLHLTDTPDHLKPAMNQINSVLDIVPPEIKVELIHHIAQKALSWLMHRLGWNK